MDQKILDALKTINDKLGGTNDPNENWGSLLQEIAQNISAPEPAASDIVVVRLTFSETSSDVTSSMTYEEIDEVIQTGKGVLAIDNYGCVYTPEIENYGSIVFSRSVLTPGYPGSPTADLNVYRVDIGEHGSISEEDLHYTLNVAE